MHWPSFCFDIVARYDGLPGLRATMKVIDAFQHRSPAEQVSHQDEQLQRLIAHAYETVPYYHQVMRAHGLSPRDIRSRRDLAALPCLTKEIIKEHRDQLLSSAFSAAETHATTTGGTTGVRMRFARDNRCLIPKQAAGYCFEKWAGWEIGQTLGVLWPVQMDYLELPTWRARLKNRIYGRLMLPAHQLDGKVLDAIVHTIRARRPTVLRGFTSPLLELATHLESQSAKPLGLAGVVSTGEPLYPHQRSVMERAFGCPVFNSYRSRELGPVAQECHLQAGMHINCHGLIVESVTSSVDAMTTELVCTDLYNYGMPFIRYRTGDSGRVTAGCCPCGRNSERIVDLEGRLADVFVTREGRTVQPGALVLYLVDEAPGELSQIQIIQEDYARFVIYVTQPPPVSVELRAYHERKLKELFGPEAVVDHRPVDAIPREASGKVIFAKSLVSRRRSDAGSPEAGRG